uniref:Uncharacterized protein n=1 Tax=Ciona savignyi TaxID=51511 RepID=H2YSV9_CIOSA
MLRSHDIQDIFVHQRHTSTTTPSQIAIKPTRQSQSLSAATSKRLIRVLPPKLPKLDQAQLVLQESTDDDVTNRVPSVTQHVDEDTSSNQLTTSSFTVSRQSSTKSLPMTSRKPPPAPPQRRSSRLTTTSREEDELRHLVSVTSSPPRSPIAPGVTSPDKPSKQAMSGIAAAVAAMALNRSHNAGKPPLVKPKPESPSSEQTNGESPLQLALAAKRASINQAVDSTSVVKPSA